MELPNQSNTWGREIESFDNWMNRQSGSFASEETALHCYLSDQLKVDGYNLPEYNHPVLGLLNDSSLLGCRVNELLYAYLALKFDQDRTKADLVIQGQRLSKNLHPEYVTRTQCYGK